MLEKDPVFCRRSTWLLVAHEFPDRHLEPDASCPVRKSDQPLIRRHNHAVDRNAVSGTVTCLDACPRLVGGHDCKECGDQKPDDCEERENRGWLVQQCRSHQAETPAPGTSVLHITCQFEGGPTKSTQTINLGRRRRPPEPNRKPSGMDMPLFPDLKRYGASSNVK